MGSSRAVDPPPAHLLHAPVEQQLSYSRYVGEESERLRARVAEERFQTKNQKRAILAEGLQNELSQQQGLLASVTSGNSAARAETNVSAEGSIVETTGRKAVFWGGMFFGLALVYAFRQKLLPSEEGEL